MKKVKIGRMYLVGLWKEHKGLTALLVVGGAILVLAAMGSGAWAAPNQSPLRATIPAAPGGTDADGNLKDLFNPTETVYASAGLGAGNANTWVNIYVVFDRAWTAGDAIPADISTDGVNTVQADANGDIWPTATWNPPLTPGEYDTIFDVNQNGFWNAGEPVDDVPVGTGFVVQAAPIPVGGIAILPNGFKLLAPRIGLAALMGVVAAAVVVMLRRQG